MTRYVPTRLLVISVSERTATWTYLMLQFINVDIIMTISCLDSNKTERTPTFLLNLIKRRELSVRIKNPIKRQKLEGISGKYFLIKCS